MKFPKNTLASILIAILALCAYKLAFILMVYFVSTDLIEFHLMSRNVFSLENFITTLSGIDNYPFSVKYILINWIGNVILYFVFIKFLKFTSQIIEYQNNNGKAQYNFSNFIKYYSISIITFYFLDASTYISNLFSFSILLLIIKLILILFFLYFEFILIKYKTIENFNNTVNGVHRLENWFFSNKIYAFKITLGKLSSNIHIHFYNVWFIFFLLILDLPLFLGGKNQSLISILFIVLIIICYGLFFKGNSFKNLKNITTNYFFLIKDSELFDIENNSAYNFLLIYSKKIKLHLLIFGIMSIIILLVKWEFILIFLFPILIYLAISALWKKNSVAIVLFCNINLLNLLFFFLIIFPKELTYKNDFKFSVIDKDASVLYQTKKGNKLGIIPLDPALLDSSSLHEYVKLEDKGFFEQKNVLPNINNWNGLSLKSFYLFLGRGGSNINAQTIKNISKITTKDVSRKLAEQLSSLMLSSKYSTDEILSLYINNINFYGGGYGTGLALGSHEYLGKSFNKMNDFEKYFTFKSIQIQKYDSLFKKSESLKNSGFIYNKSDKYSYGSIKQDNKFSLINTFMKAYIKENNGYNINDSIVQNILNENICISKPSKNHQKTFFDYFLLDKEKLNNPQSYVSSISDENCIKIDSAVNKFKIKLKSIYDENVLQLDANNKLYYASIVVDIKSGKIIGEYSNAVSNNLIYLKNPVGSTIKPLLLANYFEQSKVNPDIFSIKDNEHCMDGNCNDLKTIIGASANNNPFGNQDLIKSFDDKISNVLYEKKYNNNNVDYYKKIDKVRNYNNNNYYLGQSIELNLLNLAQLYQTLLNEGKFNRLSPFEYIYNPYTFNKDKFISKHFNPNSVQFFDINYANKVKSAMKGTFELLPNAKSGHGTQYFLLDILKNNYTYYGKSGTTSEDIGAQFGYSVIATDDILVISKVFYGNSNEGIIKNNQNNSIPSGFGSTSAGYLSAYIMNEFIN